jgi:hypothetical protein
MSPPRQNSRYRLTVEGSDDQHTIIQLLARHGYPWDRDDVQRPYVHSAGSVVQALDSIAVAAKTFERAGVVVDIDDDLSARWQAIADRLRRAGYAGLPDLPPTDGLVVEAQSLARFGVWLMPDNAMRGRLETFLSDLVDPSDPVWGHASSATAHAIASGARLTRADHRKGSLHAWLAWYDPPGMAFGTAIKALAFSHDTPLAGRFVGWFRRLYGDGTC